MTCYFRHLQVIFKKTGIALTKENRRKIDKVIHHIVRVKYRNCPAAWKKLKKRIAKDEDGFVSELKEELARWRKD